MDPTEEAEEEALVGIALAVIAGVIIAFFPQLTFMVWLNNVLPEP